ncbi:MAG: PilZ domain-containing protein [Bdellovibrionales bacterium]|nr:PilZ domain-containing protein [Bdellovibrionales bacterium]
MRQTSSDEKPRPKNKRRKYLSRLFWNLMDWLPSGLRQRWVRGIFSLDYKLPSNIVFKRAESFDEFEQAFKVIYESYRDLGLTKENINKIRVTKYNALPSTTLLIVKEGNEVIATMSVVVDSQLGLPIEELWDITELRKKGTRLAEVSTLTIKKEWRSQRGKLLFPLCKYMWEYSYRFLGVDILIAVTHPRVAHFYTDILLFKEIKSQEKLVKKYASVEGALAKAQYLQLGENTYNEWKRIYQNTPHEKNIYHFFVKTNFVNFKFPEKNNFIYGMSFMTPAQLEHFFLNQCNVLDDLSESDRLALANLYFLDKYRSVLGIKSTTPGVFDRKHPRFDVLGHVRLFHEETGSLLRGSMLEASREGLKVRLLNDLPLLKRGDVVKLNVELSPTTKVQLQTEVKWVHDQYSRLGLKIIVPLPFEWREFIDYLESQLYEKASSTKVANRIV